MRGHGRFRGKKVEISDSSASGIFDTFTQYTNKKDGSWPIVTASSLSSVSGATETIVHSNGYTYHFFKTPGTLTLNRNGTIDYLVVGGGGGGGAGNYYPPLYYRGGGGGGGGFVQATSQSFSQGTYTISIGAGANGVPNKTKGNPGSNTTLSGPTITTITAYGGGGGGGGGYPPPTLNYGRPSNASGGGAGNPAPGGIGSGGPQGNPGAFSYWNGNWWSNGVTRGGGGGGAGGSGFSNNGGAGLSAFSGDADIPSSYGNPGPSPGRFFSHGGTALFAANAVDGSGGGGGGAPSGSSGAGGDGIVIIRHVTNQ